MYDNYNRVLIYGYCGLTTVYPSSETFLKVFLGFLHTIIEFSDAT